MNHLYKITISLAVNDILSGILAKNYSEDDDSDFQGLFLMSMLSDEAELIKERYIKQGTFPLSEEEIETCVDESYEAFVKKNFKF